MMATYARFRALASMIVVIALTRGIHGQEPSKGKATVSDKAVRKLDPAVVGTLIEQLRSRDFKMRDKATQELSGLDEIPDALREAAKSGDLEVRRRAQAVINRIADRLEEKAFKALVADLHKIEIDRFVRRMATDEKFAADEKHWHFIEAVARAIIKQASQLGGQPFSIPDFDLKSLPLADLAREAVSFHSKRVLLRNGEQRITGLGNCVVLCTGQMPRMTGLTNSLVLVDGDFAGATGITNSLLIVRGNVGRFTTVHKSMIIATGNFAGATACVDSFLQVNNQRVRFTHAERSVLVGTNVKTTGDTTSRVLDSAKGPLQLLRFSERKSDAQLVWGKEVKGLAVAIAAADQKDKFFIRWKNVGKDLLEISWTRFNSDVVDKYADDLLGHVVVKGPEGRVAPARQYEAAKVGRFAAPLNNIVLGPGQTHEEIMDLWAYVEKPTAAGQYELSLALDVTSRHRLEWEAKSWTGRIDSNVLSITLGK